MKGIHDYLGGGKAGFIGSHTCVELLRRGHDVVVADDYSNSSPAALTAIRHVSGRDISAYEMDMRDQRAQDDVFAAQQSEFTRLEPGLSTAGPT